MKKTIFSLLLLFTFLNLISAQKQWKFKDLKWCEEVTPEDFKDLMKRPAAFFNGKEYVLEYDSSSTEPNTKWVKKKADSNCGSSDPNDCLVWCLVELPAEKKKVRKTFPQGTNLLVELKKDRFIEKKYYEDVVQYVFCEPNLEVKKAAIERFVALRKIRKKREKETPEEYFAFCESKFDEVLSTFQEKNSLTIGPLDAQTLIELDVIVE
jgi:hypothetical protein